jgi:hypothetical protein
MSSVFLAHSCQGDGTQRQQSVLKTAKSTVAVHCVCVACFYLATETGVHMRTAVYYSVRLRNSARERACDLSEHAQILVLPQ